MFGRHLRPEYKARQYSLVDADHHIIGTKYTSVREPVFVITGASGFLLLLALFVTGTVLPFFDIVVPGTMVSSIYLVLGLAGAFWGYHTVTEPDTEEIT